MAMERGCWSGVVLVLRREFSVLSYDEYSGRRRAAGPWACESVAVLPQLELLLRRKIFLASIRKVGAYLRDGSVTMTLAAGL